MVIRFLGLNFAFMITLALIPFLLKLDKVAFIPISISLIVLIAIQTYVFKIHKFCSIGLEEFRTHLTKLDTQSTQVKALDEEISKFLLTNKDNKDLQYSVLESIYFIFRCDIRSEKATRYLNENRINECCNVCVTIVKLAQH